MPAKITDYVKKKSKILKKKDLIKSPNLKKTFISINQHLYGKLKYTDTDTRSRSKQIVNLLLCKLVDEVDKLPEDPVDFCVKNGESPQDLYNRMQNYFINNVLSKYKEILGDSERIGFTKDLVFLIVKELQHISLLGSSKDILSDAYEIFVSKILKDEGGQFFTPPNVVKFMVKYLDPDINSLILDPACGHGGFLLEVKDLLWTKSIDEVERIKLISNLHGIDKDLFLAKICKIYLEILSGGISHIYCEDSLDPKSYRTAAKKTIENNKFDYIFTNPPFGAKIPIDDMKILSLYQLGHQWKNIFENEWQMSTKLVKKQPPQVLFIERCVQLLEDKGKMGIVLPEGIFGNPTDRYIWQFLINNGRILGIISLDQNCFQPYTCNKCSILFFQKLKEVPEDYKIDFAIVDNVGHDKDGKISYKLNKDGSKKLDSKGEPIVDDDLPDLHLKLRKAENFNHLKDQKCFRINFKQIKNKIFIPNYYTGVEKTLISLSNDKNFTLLTIGDLVKNDIIYTNKNGYLPRGDEIGSSVYGLGNVPFIRTSEINNWEINLDSNKKTSEEVYEQYRQKQKIESGDILLVKDGGSNLIGKTAYITELDTKIIIQSHIYHFKVQKNNDFIDSYLLLYLLNLDIVQKQIQAITFVQGTIATIGNRIMEVTLPIPSSIAKRKQISNYIKKIIEQKIEIKKRINQISIDANFD